MHVWQSTQPTLQQVSGDLSCAMIPSHVIEIFPVVHNGEAETPEDMDRMDDMINAIVAYVVTLQHIDEVRLSGMS